VTKKPAENPNGIGGQGWVIKIAQGRMERINPVIGLLRGKGQEKGIDQAERKKAEEKAE
jgi:hypothetical protein